jgi:predicted membrane channel-forming protein YqfA (hemolysin III family)
METKDLTNRQLLEMIAKQKAPSKSSEIEDTKEYDSKDYQKDQFSRALGLGAIMAVTFIFALWFNLSDNPLYGIALGFFNATLILMFIFIVDWVFIPGDTFINANNHRTILLIIAVSVIASMAIGSDYTPNAKYGEAKARISIERPAQKPQQYVDTSGHDRESTR